MIVVLEAMRLVDIDLAVEFTTSGHERATFERVQISISRCGILHERQPIG